MLSNFSLSLFYKKWSIFSWNPNPVLCWYFLLCFLSVRYKPEFCSFKKSRAYHITQEILFLVRHQEKWKHMPIQRSLYKLQSSGCNIIQSEKSWYMLQCKWKKFQMMIHCMTSFKWNAQTGKLVGRENRLAD